MFTWWGQTVIRTRWWVVGAALALVVAGATWGSGVFGALTGGGYDDPGSESNRTAAAISAHLGRHDPDLLVLWSGPKANPVFAAATDQLRRQPEVATVSAAVVSTDQHQAYAAVFLKATGADAKMAAYRTLAARSPATGLTTRYGGVVAFSEQANAQTKQDITRAEIFSLPILFGLLILIFRGLVAALSPLVIGGIAILGAFVAVRVLTYLTDISVFAINVITLLGLGMAVDYSLFVVSRFREQLGRGDEVPAAVRATVATAGRTVVVSGLTIVLALSSLLIFPQPFLGGMAIGGMAAVLIAMLAALTVLPAALSLLGHRIDALSRRRARTGAGWARLARSVMRRPIPYVVGVLVVLAVFAFPFTKVQWGGFDERVLPASTQARQVTAALQNDFPGGGTNPIEVLVEPSAGAFPAAVRGLPGVAGVQVSQDQLLTVTPAGDADARAVVRAIRALPAPTGATVLVGGRDAAVVDLLGSLGARLPWMALIMAAATMVLLFLAFGSVVLPVKAVLMNLVSIGASFGVVVWIFQEGHLEGLLRFRSTGFIEPSNMILVLAVLFGLATDYEVFLLSRVREEWDATGDNVSAVATGLQRTGGIITAAALLLIVVVGGFATGGVTVVKMIGVGMIVAIIVDATLVRALLVPATMRLLGRWNWWAPGSLGRMYARYGIHESAPTRT